MLSKIYCFALLLLSCSTILAQDLIVTTENDTINARITKENKKAIYFYFMKNDEPWSTMLHRSQISAYKKGFFKDSEVPKRIRTGPGYEGKRIRINTEGGLGYRVARLPSGIDSGAKDYLRKLRSGFHLGLDAHYSISETIALGVNFNRFTSSGQSADLQLTFSDGSVEQGISSDITISFIGPSAMTTIPSANKKNAFISSASIGYLHYRGEQRAGSQYVTSTGSTLGILANLGYDFGVSEHVSIGVSTSVLSGILNKIEQDENGTIQTIDLKETAGEGESLARISISLGLKFYF